MVTVLNVQSGSWGDPPKYYAAVLWTDYVNHKYWVDTQQDAYDKKAELLVLHPIGSSPRTTWPLATGYNDVAFREETLDTLSNNNPETVFSSIADYIVNVYDTETWDVWDPILPGGGSLKTIRPNIAYHINVNVACTLNLSGAPPPEPPPPEPEPPEPPPEPPTPPEDVDFWTDPLGWIGNFITGGFEAFINWFGSTFQSWTVDISNWLTSFYTDILSTITVGLANVQTWVLGIIPTLSSWWGDILLGINTWWDVTLITVNQWINSAVSGVSSWIDAGFTNIGSWWDNTATSVHNWIDDAVSAIGDFTAMFAILITAWWNTVTETVQGWISSAVEAVSSWIDSTVSNIGEWWNNTSALLMATINASIAASTSWWTDSIQSFSDWLGDLGQSFADYIGEQILNIKSWVTDTIPGVVSGMFGGIFDEGGLFGQLVGFMQSIVNALSGNYPETDEQKQAKQDILDRQEEIDNIVEGL